MIYIYYIRAYQLLYYMPKELRAPAAAVEKNKGEKKGGVQKLFFFLPDFINSYAKIEGNMEDTATYRVYSGFPGCENRGESSALSAILALMTSTVIIVHIGKLD